ncbi:MAG TPA: NAD(P)-dependent oxidoreductase [Jatrophihabitantaceae bacterium]|nr:NAD(P)-dependent oxidoreductase [Jatrophihabitantaceae bacterium]
MSGLPSGVGFIGLGNIGRPMAERLVDWPGGLWIYDVDANAMAALESQGAKAAPSPRDLAAHAGVVCVMVRDDEQVRSVLTGPDGLLAGAHTGAVIVLHSTIRAETAAEMELVSAPHGVGVLDAPVSGGAPGARDGRLAVLCGGKGEAFDAAKPVLDRMGELVVHLGPVGSGTRAKLARNLLHFVAFAATTEANRLAEAAGIDLQLLGKVVRHTDAITGGPGAIMLRDTTDPIPSDSPWFGILDAVRILGEKDLSFAIELAEQLDVDVPLARVALDELAEGLGLPRKDDA